MNTTKPEAIGTAEKNSNLFFPEGEPTILDPILKIYAEELRAQHDGILVKIYRSFELPPEKPREPRVVEEIKSGTQLLLRLKP